jgi:hypothetical protein
MRPPIWTVQGCRAFLLLHLDSPQFAASCAREDGLILVTRHLGYVLDLPPERILSERRALRGTTNQHFVGDDSS